MAAVDNYTDLPPLVSGDEAILLLANAVVERGILDCIQCKMPMEQFIVWCKSEDFDLLTRSCVNPDTLIKDVSEQREKYLQDKIEKLKRRSL